jgi:hypothetical protein
MLRENAITAVSGLIKPGCPIIIEGPPIGQLGIPQLEFGYGLAEIIGRKIGVHPTLFPRDEQKIGTVAMLDDLYVGKTRAPDDLLLKPEYLIPETTFRFRADQLVEQLISEGKVIPHKSRRGESPSLILSGASQPKVRRDDGLPSASMIDAAAHINWLEQLPGVIFITIASTEMIQEQERMRVILEALGILPEVINMYFRSSNNEISRVTYTADGKTRVII